MVDGSTSLSLKVTGFEVAGILVSLFPSFFQMTVVRIESKVTGTTLERRGFGRKEVFFIVIFCHQP